ncbi:hypothetical protein HHI36_019089 [Cryptolaemus montrouzieri]|uniref:Uncharacterized protein n=1 Tax=Cryptolaemus montrouzieri TaxID=559131 RepID=A0ABD2P2Z3_9CUCU
MGRQARIPDSETKSNRRQKCIASECCCGADVYKKIFGPTLDESLFVLILAILEFLELWKRCAADLEVTEECNDEWDEFTETSASPLAYEDEDCEEEIKKKNKRKRNNLS